MRSLRDVQKDSVDEKEEGLNIEELAPREAQIKEELRQSFIVNSKPV